MVILLRMKLVRGIGFPNIARALHKKLNIDSDIILQG